MNNYDYKADVCIVGAGPGGALLAYLLASNGISTILVERNDHINKEFRGEHLNEIGEEILRKYDLFEDLERKGLLRMERVEYWDHGEVIKTIWPDPEIGHVGIHVPQNHLLGLLLEKSRPLTDYTLLMNTKVIGLVEEDDHYSGVIAKQDGKEIMIKSSLIVGADGRFSTIRKLAQFPISKIHHGYDLLWARIPAPKNWEPTIRMALVDDDQLALFTQQGGFVQIGWNIPEGSYPMIRKQSFTPFINKLIAAFPELKDTVTENIRSWNDFILLQVQSSKSDTWVKDRVVIMGDAAHTMSPTGAFGLNSSLKDAEVLYQIIQDYKGSIQHLGSTELERFEKIRRKKVEEEQSTQLVKEASFGKQFALV
ncbi:FAD-dependent monooxygenase [Niallia sp. Krafla_26]|uniref:FAD-dependent monooxygenase n=1 Tax=Niallia sp. Krafla_26 TaxID=3064703 RepID=UPI003D183A32